MDSVDTCIGRRACLVVVLSMSFTEALEEGEAIHNIGDILTTWQKEQRKHLAGDGVAHECLYIASHRKRLTGFETTTRSKPQEKDQS